MIYSALSLSEANELWSNTSDAVTSGARMRSLEAATNVCKGVTNVEFVPVIGSYTKQLINPLNYPPGTLVEISEPFNTVLNVTLGGDDITDDVVLVRNRDLVTGIILARNTGIYESGTLCITGVKGILPQTEDVRVAVDATLTGDTLVSSTGLEGLADGNVIGVTFQNDETVYTYYTRKMDGADLKVSVVGLSPPDVTGTNVSSVVRYLVPSEIQFAVLAVAQRYFKRLGDASDIGQAIDDGVYDLLKGWIFK